MTLQTQFKKFHDTISLSWKDERMQKIREKNDSILEDIKEKFKNEGFPLIESFPQGSYITKTTIEPIGKEYDIDIGVVVSSDKAPDDPVDIKKSLRDVLTERNFKEPRIKMPCVTAQYLKDGEKSFHLDYPIYKKDDQGRYYLAIGKEYSGSDSKKWEESDPKGLIAWLNDVNSFDSEEAFAQYKRLVRYLKRWRDECIPESQRKKVYSIGLAVMTKNSFVKSISADGEMNDLISLRETVKNITNKHFTVTDYVNKKYNVIACLPTKPFLDIFNKHGSTTGTVFYNKLETLIADINTANSEAALKKQCEILRDRCFGQDFPVPEGEVKVFKEAGYIASPQGA